MFCFQIGLAKEGFEDRSMAVLLLQLFFVCASVVSYAAIVLSLFVPHLSFVWLLARAVLRDYGIFWLSSLMFSSGTLRIFQLALFSKNIKISSQRVK